MIETLVLHNLHFTSNITQSYNILLLPTFYLYDFHRLLYNRHVVGYLCGHFEGEVPELPW